MKRVIAILCTIYLCACNGGKHEAETSPKDSTEANSNYQGGQPYKDKTDTLYNTDGKRVDSSGH